MSSGPPRPLRRDLFGRMVGAAALHRPTYEDIGDDPGATPQALAVVGIVAVAAAIGTLGADLPGLVRAVALHVVLWTLVTLSAYIIGTKVIPEPQTARDRGRFIRASGFAWTPGVLWILWPVPVLGTLLWMAAVFWQLTAMVVAVRVALDYRAMWRAVAVVTAWLVLMLTVNAIIAGG